ncbi:MAG: glycosyltransferase family 39 protein [Alphaproteobacteria bacterium]|nr:glycosyltransferase family 39 protein [Alphaproteobacteria bacterium]MCB9795928.1 glycosyltransferase family 39 protein [Alphaproteobacteria bacterium]
MKRALRLLPGLLFDLLVLWAIGVVRSWAQQRGAPEAGVLGVDDIPEWWWRFGSLSDLMLVGPDAGNWASNVQAALQGQPLDAHRLPVYTFLTAWTTRIFDDIAFAGHAVNHVAAGLVPVAVYAFGRLCSGRGPAAAAAWMTALSPILINNKNHFGVDPVLHLALWTLFALSLLAARGRTWVAALAGVMAGVCAATHYLGLLFPIPMAVLIGLGQPRWWRRLLAPALMLGVAYGTWVLLMRPYPDVNPGMVVAVYAEGVAGSGAGAGVGETDWARALAFVQQRVPGATGLALQRGLRTLYGLPWGLLLLLFWVGMLGPGLPPRDEAAPELPEAGWRRTVARIHAAWDPLHTLALVALFAPLVLMEAARAPERYTLYGLPLIYLLVARGAGSLCAGLDLGLRRLWGPWPKGLLAIGAGLALVMATQHGMRLRWPGIAPYEEGLQDRAVGQALREAFPQERGEASIVTSSQNLPFYSGRRRCPAQPCRTAGEQVVATCAAQLLSQCLGSGDLPYVVERRLQHGFADKPNEQMDAAIAERFPVVTELEGAERSVVVYRVPRAGLEALATVDGVRIPAPAPPPLGTQR